MGSRAVYANGHEADRLARLSLRARGDLFLEALRAEYGRQLAKRGVATNVRPIAAGTADMRAARAEALRRQR